MAQLTSLSNDLLLHLADYIDHEDCQNLRLTCDAFADVFAFHVLPSFVIQTWAYVGKETKRPVLDILKWMAGGYSVHKGRVEAIKMLRIASLSPANYIPEDKSDDAAMLEKCSIFDQEIMGILELALIALPNVKTFSWHPYARDPISSHEIVARTVSRFPQLGSLNINMPDLPSPVLTHFKDLTHISYNTWKLVPDVVVVDSFTKAVIQSPKLRSFCFTAAEGSQQDLDRVIGQWIEAGITTTLRSLEFRRCAPSIKILPYLRQLSSLEIISASCVGRNAEERHQIFQDLWLGVTKSELRLRHISVDRVPDALVDYLKSYHGLERFSFCNSHEGEDDAIENVYLTAERFYAEALDNHFATLELLDIDLYYDDEWSVRPAYQQTLYQCVNLRSLAVGFEGGLGHESTSLHVLLDNIPSKCPLLQDLTIHRPVTLNRSSPQSGQGAYYIRKAMWENTQHAIFTWVAPPSTSIKQLPKISLSGSYSHYYYVAQEKNGTGPIKYFERSIGDYFNVTENDT